MRKRNEVRRCSFRLLWVKVSVYLMDQINSFAYLSCFVVKIGQMSRVFANSPQDQSSIPGRVIPKTHKMVLDAALLNTQHYKVRIKSKLDAIQRME